MTPSLSPMPRLQQEVNELENLVDRLEHDLDTAQKRNESIEKQLLAMREALISELDWRNCIVDQTDLCRSEVALLTRLLEITSPNISRKYVKREVLDQLVNSAHELPLKVDNFYKALALARKELEK